jgi:hypothetical protein
MQMAVQTDAVNETTEKSKGKSNYVWKSASDIQPKFHLINHEICFIPIRIIVPTSILVAGFDEEKKPYKKISNIHHENNLFPYIF